MSSADITADVRLLDLEPAPERLCDDVIAGLSGTERRISPKYFYDDLGAELFERITTLDEYYPTRTEISILERHGSQIGEFIGSNARVVEFGSGAGIKTRLLLRCLDSPAAYVPIDIARSQLIDNAAELMNEFPGIEILPVCADYSQPLRLPEPARTPSRTAAFFPGSTIGNMEPAASIAFLRRVADLCGPDGRMVLGFDLHKDRAVLERAYNDSEGVTAAFNLNLLSRINRECGADFDLAAFRHEAVYDETRNRMEMRLIAVHDTTVIIPDDSAPPRTMHFAAGQFITTEYSHKYTDSGIRRLVEDAGWGVERLWCDARGWFGVAGLGSLP